MSKITKVDGVDAKNTTAPQEGVASSSDQRVVEGQSPERPEKNEVKPKARRAARSRKAKPEAELLEDEQAEVVASGGARVSGGSPRGQGFEDASDDTSGYTLSTQAQQGGFNMGYLLLGLVVLGAAAGGGGGGPSRKRGFLIDSPVGGVEYYINGVLQGVTGADGSFLALPTDKVTFKVGSVTLGEVSMTQDGFVYLQDLAGVARTDGTDPKVVRLAQLLQSLDADGDPSNGIRVVIDRLRDGLPETSITNDTVVPDLLDKDVPVVSEPQALAHMNDNNPALKSLDDVGPSVQLEIARDLIGAGQPVQVTMKFSEPVKIWGDAASIFELNGGGEVSNLRTTDGGRTYLVDYVAPASPAGGEVTIVLKPSYSDLAGNAGTKGSVKVKFDNSLPTVEVVNRLDLKSLSGTTSAEVEVSTIPLGTDGRYATAWTSVDKKGFSQVLVQVYDATGAEVGRPVELRATDGGTNGRPKIAAVGSEGRFVVVWEGQDNTEGGSGIFLQSFDANGVRDSRPRKLDAEGGRDEKPMVSAIGSDGSYAVTWLSTPANGEPVHVVQRYSAQGQAIGTSQTYATGAQQRIQVADILLTPVGGDGSYVLTWSQVNSEGNGSDILTQKHNAQGIPVSEPVRVASGVEDTSGMFDAAAVGATGASVLTWKGIDATGNQQVFVQRFAADGAAIGTPMSVSGTGAQASGEFPQVEPIGTEGAFVLSWCGKDAGGDTSVFVQRFRADGTPEAQPIILEAKGNTSGADTHVKLVSLANAQGYAVAWEGTASGGDTNVYVQTYDLLGKPKGQTQTLAVLESSDERSPVVTALPSGGFVVGFNSEFEDSRAAYSQAFNADGTPLVVPRHVGAADLATAGIEIFASEAAKAFLVHNSIAITPRALELTDANSNKWNSVELTETPFRGSIPTAGLVDGDYRLVLMDAAGNLSAPTNPAVRIDTVLPTVVITDSEASGIANGEVTYTFSFSKAPVGFSADDVTVENGTKGDLVPVTTGFEAGKVFTMIVTPENGKAGDDIGVKVGKQWSDRSGNGPATETSAAPQPFDRVNPDAPKVALRSDTGRDSTDTITNDPSFIATGEEGALIEYSVDGKVWSATKPEAVEGKNVVLVRQTDTAGNISETSTVSFVLDKSIAAPEVALVSDTGSSSSDTVTSNSALASKGEEEALIEYSTDGKVWTPTQPEAVEGKNTVLVRQTDVAGNVSDPTTFVFTLDKSVAKPTLQLASDTGREGEEKTFSDGVTSNPTVNVSGLEAQGSWEYQIVGTDTWTPGTGTSFNAVEGSKTYLVRQTDLAGNIATSEPFNVNFVATAPTVSVQLLDAQNQALVGTFSNKSGTQLKVFGDTSDLLQYRFVDANSRMADWINLNQSATIQIGEGTSNIETRKIDIAGNLAVGLTRVTVDTVAAAPKMVLASDTGTAGDGVTTDPRVIIEGLESRAKWEVRVVGQPEWNVVSNGSNTFTLQLGKHEYEIRQTDAAGNTSEIGRYTFTYLSEVDLPKLTANGEEVRSGLALSTNATELVVAGLIDGATWSYRIDGGEWIQGTGTTIPLNKDNAVRRYEVRQESGGKNSEPFVVEGLRYDATPPSTLNIALSNDSGSSGDDGITNQNGILVSGVEAGARLEYRIGTTGPWQKAIHVDGASTIPMLDGKNAYTFRQIDAAGNTSQEVSRICTYIDAELAAPTLFVDEDTAATDDGVTSKGKISVNFVSGDGVTWQYMVNDNGQWINGSGNSFNANFGKNSYKARQIDVAGNTSPVSEPLVVTLDNAAPFFTSSNRVRVADPDSERPELIPTSQVLHTVKFIDTTTVNLTISDNDFLALNQETGAITFKSPTGFVAGATNSYSAEITATDLAGNVARQTITIDVGRTNTAAPSVNLGEIRSGLRELFGSRFFGFETLSDSTFVTIKEAFSNGKNVQTIQRVDREGALLGEFTSPSAQTGILSYATDASDRVYVVYAIDSFTNPSISGPLVRSLSVVRYLKDGTVDTSYGTNGSVLFTAPQGTVYSQRDGNYSGKNITADNQLGRLSFSLQARSEASPLNNGLSDGVLFTIDANGSNFRTTVWNGGTNSTEVLREVEHGTGSIAYVTASNVANINLLQKYDNGVLQSSFGNNGSVAIGDSSSIAVDSSNRVIVLQYGFNQDKVTVVRYTANGQLDSSFQQQTLTLPANKVNNSAEAKVIVDPATSHIYVLVTYAGGDRLYKFESNGAPSTAFGGKGFIDLSPSGTLNNGIAVAGSVYDLTIQNGKLFIYGEGEGLSVRNPNIRVIDLVRGIPDDSFGQSLLVFNEGSRPVGLLTGRSLISDADQIERNYEGFRVTVIRDGGMSGDDRFGARGDLLFTETGRIFWKNEDVGSVSNIPGRLDMTFNANTSHQELNELLRSLTYRNSSQTESRTITLAWTVSDGDPAGAKATVYKQGIIIRDDNADVVDNTLTARANNVTIDFSGIINFNGKQYRRIAANRADLDGFFNAGLDTTEDARTVVLSSGLTVKLLTEAEITSNFAASGAPTGLRDTFIHQLQASSPSFTFYVVAADDGAVEGSHRVYNAKTKQWEDLADSASPTNGLAYAYVEVIDTAAPAPDFVPPALKLLVDNGDSTTDRLTSDGRLLVEGLSNLLPYEYSLDGGTTWISGAVGNMIFEIPEGTYGVGQVQVRQTDLSGFSEVVKSGSIYKIDKSIKGLGLLNDQGLSFTDGITADGRVLLTGVSADFPYEYTINRGTTWIVGGKLSSGEFGFVLPAGSYNVGDVQIRQKDANDFTSTARNISKIEIDPIVGQGKITIVVDNGDDKTDGATSDDRVQVTGLVPNVAFEYSTDRGQNWTTVAAANVTKATFVVPEKTYGVGDLVVRQVEPSGFTSNIINQVAYKVDKTVKTVGLLNDQGVSTSDNTSADGRVLVKGYDLNLPYEFSTNGGQSWQVGTKIGNDFVFTLPAGAYSAGRILVRQTDGGITQVTKTESTIVVGPAAGQGIVRLEQDLGNDSADGLTSNNRLQVTGLRDNVDWEYSLDNGSTWKAGVRVAGAVQTIGLPDGSYAANTILVRQLDPSGFTTQLRNGNAVTIDRKIGVPSISLVEDTGIKNDDFLTANGQVKIDLAGLSAGETWQYSTNSGASWTNGVGSSQTITLANGTYAAGAVRVNVFDAAGNLSSALFSNRVVVDNTDNEAPEFTSNPNGLLIDRDGTDTKQTVSALVSGLTVQTKDANDVYYSLSGADAELFNINNLGQISFKQDTNLKNALGDKYKLTVIAEDAFSNKSSQEVTISVVNEFKEISRSVKDIYSTINDRQYVLEFSHDIKLDTTKEIFLRRDDSSVNLKLDLLDPKVVRIDGNKLIVATDGLTVQGRYLLDLGSAIVSTITNEPYTAPRWPQAGFEVRQAMEYAYSFQAGKKVFSSKGSYVVGAPDGSDATGTVAVLGDINGDGIDDWAISSGNGDNLGRNDNGKTYVIYGRSDGAAPDLNQIANGQGGFLISGRSSGDLAGTRLFAAGDVNGDGLADIGIHATGGSGGLGRGYVVFGTRNGSNLDLTTLENNSALGRFYTTSIRSFDPVGDVNGDGFDDVAHGRGDLDRRTSYDVKTVSTTRTTATSTLTGKADWLNFAANIFDGLATIYAFFDDPLSATIETGAEWQDKLDLAIQDNKPEEDPIKQAVADEVKRYSGLLRPNQRIVDIDVSQTGGGGGGFAKPPKDLVITIKFTVETTNTSVTRFTTDQFGAGEAIVELGGVTGNSGSTRVIGTINATQVGAQQVALGDINGDGRADFGVLESGSGGVLARLNVVLGTRNLGEVPTTNLDSGIGGFRIFDPRRTTELVGDGSVAGLGDINGDGISDFSLTLDATSATTYVVYGRAGMTSVNLAEVANGRGGYVLSGPDRRAHNHLDAIGDFNGDGIDDYVYYRNAGSFAGEAFVIFGGTKAPPSKSFLKDADLENGKLGFVINPSFDGLLNVDGVSAGDINGDGLTDILLRTGKAETIVIMGSTDSGKFGQVKAEQIGTAGNDSLVSSGSDLIIAGLGNDTITTKGADVVLAGAGNDRVILDQGMVTALQNVLGAGGNTDRLSKIDGGAGRDVLQFTDGISLDFTRVSNKMLDLSNISGRVSNVEEFDLRTDTASNTLTLSVNDVLEMGNANVFNGSNGWSGLSSTVNATQIAVAAGQNDTVQLVGGWSKIGTATEAAVQYDVWQANNGVAAQVLIQQGTQVL